MNSLNEMAFDVARVRAAYPALADGYAYLDGAAGTQLPESVIDAVAGAYRAGIGNSGGAFPASRRSDEITAECRRAVADLTGGRPEGVILGPNMTTLTYRLARTLAAGWGPGDEIVVTRLDHDANVRPWVQAAARAGAAVRWADVQLPEGDLPLAQFAELISDRTRLVAVSAASNLIGTRPDVAGITALAHAAGALAYVDGVHATPHGPVDVARARRRLLRHERLQMVRAARRRGGRRSRRCWSRWPRTSWSPAPDAGPDRFEQGTLPFADLAGVTAAVEHLASLAGPAAGGTRRERILAGDGRGRGARAGPVPGAARRPGRDGARHHLRQGGPAHRHRVLHRGRPHAAPGRRAPGRAEGQRLGRRQLRLGTGRARWACGTPAARVRAGLVHYNDRSDVDRLLAAVAELAA